MQDSEKSSDPVSPVASSGQNRLSREISPYLLQHAANPVDWYPWGEEALAKARDQDKPIFLSIGYSSCHWCHVMEHESFENDEIAQVLNEHFVSIKVDREERPDIDDVYMTATQIISGRGGWPNSVFLMPDGRPFYAGTYFPPSDRQGMPGFRSVLRQLAALFRDQRQNVMKQADEISRAMQQSSGAGKGGPGGSADPGMIAAAIENLKATFDSRFGGFGSSPKFPPHGALRFLLHEWRVNGSDDLAEMVTVTLDRMAAGGIHDHLAGGFARYSTDEIWLVPHFEKMLYDNAQLLRSYAAGFAATGRGDFRRAAEGIVSWVRAEMTSSEGAFYSALDADSEGVEGKYYVFTRQEVFACLGDARGGEICELYNIRENGNFIDSVTGVREETNIPFLDKTLEEYAAEKSVDPGNFVREVKNDLDRLLEYRRKRVRPGLDDKIQASWNGLLIGALASASVHLDDRSMLADAERAAQYVLSAMRVNGRLMHSCRNGDVRYNGYLDDHAFMAEACLDLYQATRNTKWLSECRNLLREIRERFRDADSGACFFTSHDHERLLLRNMDAFDKAEPSGNGIYAVFLARLASVTGENDHAKEAERVIAAFSRLMARAPGATMNLHLALALVRDLREEKLSVPIASEDSAGDDSALEKKFPVALSVSPAKFQFHGSGSMPLGIAIAIDDGWHINSHRPGMEYMRPTLVTVEKPGGDGAAIEGIVLTNIVYPAGEKVKLEFGSGELSVYSGAALITAELMVDDSARRAVHQAVIVLSYQPCDHSQCLARDELAVPIEVEILKG